MFCIITHTEHRAEQLRAINLRQWTFTAIWNISSPHTHTHTQYSDTSSQPDMMDVLPFPQLLLITACAAQRRMEKTLLTYNILSLSFCTFILTLLSLGCSASHPSTLNEINVTHVHHNRFTISFFYCWTSLWLWIHHGMNYQISFEHIPVSFA